MLKKNSPGQYLFFMIICIACVVISIINAYEAKLAGNDFRLFWRSLTAIMFSGWAVIIINPTAP